jgi:hypothetical protein
MMHKKIKQKIKNILTPTKIMESRNMLTKNNECLQDIYYSDQK